MKKLIKEQEKFFEEEKIRLENFFEEPEYQNYKIVFVENDQNPDVYISGEHNNLDYLTIGFACLAKHANGDNSNVILVGDKDYPNCFCIKPFNQAIPSKHGEKYLPPTALSDSLKNIEIVLNQYYKDPKRINIAVLLNFCFQATGAFMRYINSPDIDLNFKDFTDTMYAQKLAYENIKRHVISSKLGVLYKKHFREK